MDRRPFAQLTDVAVTDHRTRRGILRLAAGAGAGVTGVVSAVAALGKKKRKKKKCKKRPVTLQTDLIACPGPRDLHDAFPNRVAQTFTAVRTGALTAAQVELGTDGVPGMVIEIRAVGGDSVPTDEVLASVNVGEIPNPPPPSPFVTLSALFDPPASVVKDTQYAVVVTATGPSFFAVPLRDSDACAGELYSDLDFFPQPGEDLIFAVSITFAT